MIKLGKKMNRKKIKKQRQYNNKVKKYQISSLPHRIHNNKDETIKNEKKPNIIDNVNNHDQNKETNTVSIVTEESKNNRIHKFIIILFVGLIMCLLWYIYVLFVIHKKY